MPHVGCQQGKLGLDIDPGAIPAQQGLDCEGVPLIPGAELAP